MMVTASVETRSDSSDVATPLPRLSWKSSTTSADWTQRSAEIELDSETRVVVDGHASVLVDWPFAPLTPRERHSIRVRVTGIDGETSEWSESTDLVAAFLAPDEWQAAMIELSAPAAVAQPALFRHEFDVLAGLSRATLYATAHGAYDVFINGHDVDDQVMKPGWTPYDSRLVHESTDVTALLTEGPNAIGIALAGAWYTERYGYRPAAQPQYGEQPAAAAQLVLEYVDGTRVDVATGAEWRATADGPLTESGLFDGETYDALRVISGWARTGFDDSAWSEPVVGRSAVTPSARTSPAVRPIEERFVVEVLASSSGSQILDFGQNLVGRLRIRVSGEAGTVVTLRHAEVLENGGLGVRPLRTAEATDRYILSGNGVEVWEPRFTFHGFRYAEITGLPQPVDPSAITAVVIHSDMRRTGWFTSSHALLNQLHENVVWGMRGNFLYLPTDCPQRDERLGWTGDIQVFAPTASFLYDTNAFLSSWLTDVAIEQAAIGNGSVPFVVPNVLSDAATPAAAWGDAATVVPSVLHERYGDLGVIAAQYASMRGWADHLLGIAGKARLWLGGFQFGDWLDPTAPPHDAFQAKTDAELIATAYLYRSVSLVARAAELLGESADATHYGAEADKVRAAFLGEYVSANGRMVSDAQTAYSLAIGFGLYSSETQRVSMGDRLALLVRRDGYRIATGFVGTPIIEDALTETGHLDAAGRLLTQTENPSWLYPVTMGATTIWERWDSMLEDGSINPGEMTSFNHYALGAVADYLHRSIGGLSAAEPGYRVIRIEPRPIAQLEHAESVLDTPYGRASSGWRRDGDTIVVTAVIPPNTRAIVALPDAQEILQVGSGNHTWIVAGDDVEEGEADELDRLTSLARVIDDETVYRAVCDAIDAVDPALAKRFRTTTKWTEGAPLSQALNLLPGNVGEAVDRALENVNRQRAQR